MEYLVVTKAKSGIYFGEALSPKMLRIQIEISFGSSKCTPHNKIVPTEK